MEEVEEGNGEMKNSKVVFVTKPPPKESTIHGPSDHPIMTKYTKIPYTEWNRRHFTRIYDEDLEVLRGAAYWVERTGGGYLAERVREIISNAKGENRHDK
uniref:Uncharacterized protein n=2 Tax=viral metagenome TaxID=1070528 RepID=A0A6M3K9K0_9ZZZZ